MVAGVVDRKHCFEDTQRHIMILRRLDQRTGVPRKARPAEARASVWKLASDAIIEADATRDLLNVGAGALGEISDLVTKVILVGRRGCRLR